MKRRNTMNSKRITVTLLITMTIVALVALGGAKSNVRGEDYKSVNQLAGTWEVTVMPAGGAPIIDYVTFHEGGGLTNIDPDPNLSAGLGTWERLGPNRFASTFVHFLSDHGTPLGLLKVNADATFDSKTETLSGPFRTDVIIGGNVVQSICGTVELRRVNVEALEACP
jgi:hypothetical protein